MFSLLLKCVSYVSGLLVVVDVVDVSSQTEVSDLHHVVFSDQHVSGCQVSVNTLKDREEGQNRSRSCLWDPEEIKTQPNSC